MKSESGSRRQASSWRVKSTLKRKPHFRPIEDIDLRFIFAAYRKGALESMGGKFADTSMSPEAFTEEFTADVMTRYSGAWVLFPSKTDERPGGLVLGFWSHPDPDLAPFMIIGDMIWFPWTSPRNRVEAAVGFFANIRKEIPMVEYARREHTKFFEVMARHGVMRRIGVSHNVYPGETTHVFETRV